jgi:hypothetical protein
MRPMPVLLCASVSVLCAFSCSAFDDGDFQYWSTNSVSWRIQKDWYADLEEELRLGDDGGHLYYQHSDLGVRYSGLAPWLELGANYRQVFEKKNSDWKQENRPHINVSVKAEVLHWAVSNRSRMEYRNREDADDFWRYTNKSTVKFPWKWSVCAVQPYVAEELYVDFDQKEYNENRLYGGFSLKIYKNLSGEIFYLWRRTKKSGEWSEANILGSKLKFSF